MNRSVSVGDRVSLEIESVAFGGSGVGRVETMVVFVPFTVDGDIVDVEITEVKKRYARGNALSCVKASPFRVRPECSYFARCGGCDYQHIHYGRQLKMKERQVVETYKRIGRIDTVSVGPVVPSPKPFRYRGKAEYHAERNESGDFVFGFMDVTGGRLLDIENCSIVEESIQKEQARLRRDEDFRKGVRERERCIVWSDTAYRASASVSRTVKGVDMSVPYGGFFQANTSLVGTLVDYVIEAAELERDDTVLDCYCGSGLFSLFVAPSVEKVYGIEISRAAVACARENLDQCGVVNARMTAGDVSRVLRQGMKAGIVILDPPREGCDREVLDHIGKMAPRRIVYVSCNPATQARDAGYMSEKGYSIKTIQPFDMFPQTKHIECVAVMEKKGAHVFA